MAPANQLNLELGLSLSVAKSERPVAERKATRKTRRFVDGLPTMILVYRDIPYKSCQSRAEQSNIDRICNTV